MKLSTKVAIEAAEKAGKMLSKLVLKNQHERIKEKKFSMDIVTDSDLQAEKLITQIIHHYFPAHDLLSEETRNKTDPRRNKHLWIVDPIDGTIAFASNLPFYSVSISYFVDQEPESSALFLASTQEVLWAEKGKGAYIGRRKLYVNDKPLDQCVIAFDASFRKRKVAMYKLAPALSLGIRFLQMTSGEAGNLGLVARGNLQGLICVYPDIWDYAAGLHIVGESGGIITDFRGKPYRMFTSAGHVASTKSAHPFIIEHTQQVAKYFMR